MTGQDKSAAESVQLNVDLFFPLQFDAEFPGVFPSPFEVTPHAVAAQAADSLKHRLPQLCAQLDAGDECASHEFESIDGGKMFGVLVVKDEHGNSGYLSAFSGMLGQVWNCAGFVPPVFDQLTRQSLLSEGEQELLALQHSIDNLESDKNYLQFCENLESYQSSADAEIQNLKQTLQKNKSDRHLMRQKADIDSQTLKTLAQQSRTDKLAFKQRKTQLQNDSAELRACVLEFQNRIDALVRQRKTKSRRLQAQLFAGYQLRDTKKNISLITRLFVDGLPPSGAGDCAAVKLLQYANLNRLKPLALAEFWWGAAPAGGLRQHGRYYPACRSRCRVLLPPMLNGLSLATPRHEQSVSYSDEYPVTLYEDRDIVLVEKPAGLLSVPGKVLTDSVETRLKARYPEVEGVMLLHRLDQATSGVMIAAKHPRAYKVLQHQFQDRSISKRYIALLDGVLDSDQGKIELPLRLDYYDRPRQMVCAERGKQALTRYEVLSRENSTTRVAFYPHTGRTHQLRVHAAHSDGLNTPILGDELYGRPLERLHLHAEEISFNHPVSGDRMSVSSVVTF